METGTETVMDMETEIDTLRGIFRERCGLIVHGTKDWSSLIDQPWTSVDWSSIELFGSIICGTMSEHSGEGQLDKHSGKGQLHSNRIIQTGLRMINQKDQSWSFRWCSVRSLGQGKINAHMYLVSISVLGWTQNVCKVSFPRWKTKSDARTNKSVRAH